VDAAPHRGAAEAEGRLTPQPGTSPNDDATSETFIDDLEVEEFLNLVDLQVKKNADDLRALGLVREGSRWLCGGAEVGVVSMPRRSDAGNLLLVTLAPQRRGSDDRPVWCKRSGVESAADGILEKLRALAAT
jgi:hypothetical protein